MSPYHARVGSGALTFGNSDEQTDHFTEAMHQSIGLKVVSDEELNCDCYVVCILVQIYQKHFGHFQKSIAAML